MRRGYMYLFAIIDVYTRYVVGWTDTSASTTTRDFTRALDTRHLRAAILCTRRLPKTERTQNALNMALDDAMGFLSGTAFMNAMGTVIADGLLPGRARFLVRPQHKNNDKSPICDYKVDSQN